MLNTLRSDILIKINGFAPMDSPKPSSKGLRTRIEVGGVRFIRDYGHNTKYWWDLDRVPNDLAKKEKLDNYLKYGLQSQGKRPDENFHKNMTIKMHPSEAPYRRYDTIHS